MNKQVTAKQSDLLKEIIEISSKMLIEHESSKTQEELDANIMIMQLRMIKNALLQHEIYLTTDDEEEDND